MIPQPIALGLTLCDYVIVEEGTQKVSLIGNLTQLRADRFPYLAATFWACAALTDGLGDATVEVVATRLETSEQIYAQRRLIHFDDRLSVLDVLFSVSRCSFPAPGWYQFTLLADEEWLAQRRLQVLPREN